MEAAKDLLRRAVELDSADKYSEALICYEEGIQNILRALGGSSCYINQSQSCSLVRYCTVPCLFPILLSWTDVYTGLTHARLCLYTVFGMLQD